MTRPLPRLLQRWDRFWFQPFSTATLGLVRIAFGGVMVAWSLSLLPDLMVFFSTRGIVEAQPIGAWPWGLLALVENDAAVVALWGVFLFASLSLMIGFRSRLASVLVFVALVSFQRRNPYVFNTGDLLIRVTAFFLMLSPSGAALSLDRWRQSRDDFWMSPQRTQWGLRLIQIQLSVVYLSGVWAKLRGTAWPDGTAVSIALRIEDIARFPVPAFVTDSAIVSSLATYGTLALETALGIFIWNRRLRPWVLGLGVMLHLSIDYALLVGFFSYVIFVNYLAFIPPERADSMVEWLRTRPWKRSKARSVAHPPELERL
jgi:hypothetical protein